MCTPPPKPAPPGIVESFYKPKVYDAPSSIPKIKRKPKDG